MAIELSGTGQYLTAATGFSLGANSAVWAVCRFRLDTTATTQTLLTLGVSGSANNRRDVIWVTTSGGQLQVRAINNAGASQGVVVAYTTGGAWATVIAEWASSTSRAVTVNNGTRQTSAISNALTTGPNEVRVGATHTASALLDGRVAWYGIWSGAPTTADRAACFANAHPRLISPSTLLEAWDLGNASNLTGWRGTVLTATGTPTTQDSPRLYLPQGRSLIAVPLVAPPGDLSVNAADTVSIAESVTLQPNRLLATAQETIAVTDAATRQFVDAVVTTTVVAQYRSLYRGVFARIFGRVN